MTRRRRRPAPSTPNDKADRGQGQDPLRARRPGGEDEVVPGDNEHPAQHRIELRATQLHLPPRGLQALETVGEGGRDAPAPGSTGPRLRLVEQELSHRGQRDVDVGAARVTQHGHVLADVEDGAGEAPPPDSHPQATAPVHGLQYDVCQALFLAGELFVGLLQDFLLVAPLGPQPSGCLRQFVPPPLRRRRGGHPGHRQRSQLVACRSSICLSNPSTLISQPPDHPADKRTLTYLKRGNSIVALTASLCAGGGVPMTVRVGPGLRLGGLIGFEAVSVTLLWGGDRAGLGGVEWSRLDHWLSAVPPEEALLVAVRAVAFVLAAWLLLSTLGYLLARLADAPGLVRGARWATAAGVRRLVDAAVAVSVLGGAYLGPRPAFAQAPPPNPVVIELSVPAPHLYTPVAAGDGAPAAPEVTATPGATVQQNWTVAPGDCFWTVAEEVLTTAWGRAPTDAEIVPYWRELIDANLSVLVERDNPDLIHPGQVFALPPPTATDVTG